MSMMLRAVATISTACRASSCHSDRSCTRFGSYLSLSMCAMSEGRASLPRALALAVADSIARRISGAGIM